MPPRHIMLCYLGSADNDDVLIGAVELCEESGAELSVLLRVIDSPVPDGCCGIQGERWQRLMDDETRNAAERAERVLKAWGRRPRNVVVVVGPSIPDTAVRVAARFGCDVVAVGSKRRRWSTGGLPRRQLKELHRLAPGRVLELPGTG